MDEDKYLGLKRLISFLAAVGLWGVSIYFSYVGFKFESTVILWFGIVLALVVTVVELVFNTKITQLNPTLLVGGILCYVYGVYTNVTGFYVLQHPDLSDFFTGSNWVIPAFGGIVCEVLPEALFAWAVGAGAGGDLLGNIMDIFGGTSSKPKNNQNQYPKPAGNIFQGQGQSKKQSPSSQYNLQKPSRQTQQPRPPQPNRNTQHQIRPQAMRDIFEDDDNDEDTTPPFSRAEPTYHPIGMNAQGDMRKRFDA